MNATIRDLDLSGNDIGDKGCQYVAETLKENTILQDLVGGLNVKWLHH